MSFHIPNPVLMAFTLVGGFACSMLFLQSRNLFVLGSVSRRHWIATLQRLSKGMDSQYASRPGIFSLMQ